MAPDSSARRVVITGIGSVSTFGWGCESLLEGLRSGRTGIGTTRNFDTSGHRTRLAAEAPDVSSGIAQSFSGWRTLSQADRFAVFAAGEATEGAGLTDFGSEVGIYFGGSTAGMAECEEWVGRLLGCREGAANLSLLASQQLSGPGDAVARHLGVRGPVQGFSSACASGALAVGAAVEAVRDGEIEVAVAGGSDSLCQLTFAGFNSLRSVDEAPCRPFRADRAGLSLGEGAGVLVLEDAERAAARGAVPLAEVLGFGSSCDAHHMTAPHPEGEGALAAMRAALDDAGVPASALSAVNTHGTGTPHNDVTEACALSNLVGGARIGALPLMAPKASFGHVLGAAGALEAVVSVLALRERCVFAAPGGGSADPELGVDLVVDEARPMTDSPAVWVSSNFAFGGANAAILMREWAEARG